MIERIHEALRDKGIASRYSEVLCGYPGRPLKLMEVCGTHTMSIAKYGIKSLLPESIKLVSGPGCPVCVTSLGYLDTACRLALRSNTIIATFGDMFRVPGSRSSLQKLKADGCDIRIVYSPLDCIQMAQNNQDRSIVFLSVGFETTTPSSALLAMKAREKGLRNIFLLTANKTIPIVLEKIVSSGSCCVDGLLYPGHVSAIIGTHFYEHIAAEYHVPGVVSGFEPVDILHSISILVNNITHAEYKAVNAYGRIVKREGNRQAQEIINSVFEPCDANWRGIGPVVGSGLALRKEYSDMDAWKVFGLCEQIVPDPEGCLCGEVITGKRTPPDCVLFGQGCTPESPVGPCMVSGEGSCAAHYKYLRK